MPAVCLLELGPPLAFLGQETSSVGQERTSLANRLDGY